MGEFGIETLKQDLLTICKTIKKVDNALEDDKISLSEGIGFAFELPGFFKLVKSYKDAIKELSDLDSNELNELNVYFAEQFDISDDKAEKIVEQIIEVVLSVASAMIASK